jgi:hypothetical protein
MTSSSLARIQGVILPESKAFLGKKREEGRKKREKGMNAAAPIPQNQSGKVEPSGRRD